MTFFSISSHVLFEVAEGMKVIEFNEVIMRSDKSKIPYPAISIV